METSKIIICKDLEYAKEKILQILEERNYRLFFEEEFKVDNVKEVIREAYIAEDETKYIILIAKNYNIYSQNALLKILEEPPKNIIFILVAPSKTIFLPTIRSRMTIQKWDIKKERKSLDIDLNRLSLKDIFLFLKENRFLKKEESKEIIEAMLSEALLKYDITLNEKEMERFQKALELTNLNTRSLNVFANLFLTLLLREKK